MGASGSSRFLGQRGRTADGTGRSGVRYPSPFFDIGHTYLPPSMKQLLRWCRYYYLVNPLINAVIHKMSEYPITEIIIDEKNASVKKKWEALLQSLRYRAFQIEVGLDYNCFHGDEKVTTSGGVFRLRDLAGKAVDVLSQDGTYRPADFKSFGVQRLLEVEFGDGRTCLATPEHQWPVVTHSGNVVKVSTTELQGRRLLRNVAPRPVKDEGFYEGVRHGFVFGDGTLYNNGEQARGNFCGTKDLEMLKYFEGHGSPPYTASPGVVVIHGLPPEYKSLPKNEVSAGYWYGFLCGFLAADGSVDVNGCTVLTQRAKTTLEVISDQLPRIGMVAGRVRGYEQVTEYGEGEMHYLSLLKPYMQADDFLLSHHRAKFEENFRSTTNRHHVHVTAVRETGIVDEVFCCVEPETHTFTIGNGVLTGNCYGICVVTLHLPFTKYLICSNCKLKSKASKIGYKWRNLEYTAECAKCGHYGSMMVQDYYEKDLRRIRLQRWNPEYVNIEPGFGGADPIYTFELPLALKNDILLGKKSVLDSIPDTFIEALKRNKFIRFADENVFVFKRPIISQKDDGWGMPLILPVLKDSFYLQILRKAQEMIAQEHIVPLRVLFPQAGSGTSDPYTTIPLDAWKSRIEGEISKWKYDQNYIPILPLPIGNQTIGGDGKALGLYQEMEVWSRHIVAGMGVPEEFVFGGMQYSGSNVSMRMLENMFIGYRTDHENMLNDFIIKRIAHFMGWPVVRAHMRRFKMADDLQRTAFYFQLNQAMKISDQTLLQEADQDPGIELLRREQELNRQLAYQKKMQMAQAATAGEASLIQAKYQAEAQKVMAAAMPQPQPGADPNAQPGQPPAAGAEGEMIPGQQADPGMPEGSSVSTENAQGAPQEGVPETAQSPLTMGAKGGGYNLIYLAKRAANQLSKMDEMQKNQELQRMQLSNPQLYMLVIQTLRSSQGSQADPLDAQQSPLPEQRPTRRASSVGV